MPNRFFLGVTFASECPIFIIYANNMQAFESQVPFGYSLSALLFTLYVVVLGSNNIKVNNNADKL